MARKKLSKLETGEEKLLRLSRNARNYYRRKKVRAKQMYEKQYENLFQKMEVNDYVNK